MKGKDKINLIDLQEYTRIIKKVVLVGWEVGSGILLVMRDCYLVRE